MLDAPSVWVDDSHAIFRRGISACLATGGFTVRGESARLEPAPPLTDLDILVFECVGTSLRRSVRLTEGAPIRLIALVRSSDEAELRSVVEAGVSAILLATELTPESLVATVHAVAHGAAALPKDLLSRILLHAAKAANAANTAHAASGLHAGLAPRERDVLRLLAEGLDTREIAVDLCFSERTVKNVVHDVLMKLNCRTRAHAVALATRTGVI